MLRIATWNLSHAVKHDRSRRAAGWRHLREFVAPDVALVQEGGIPFEGAQGSVAAATDRDWTTSVVSYGPPIEPFVGPVHPSWNAKLAFPIPDIAVRGTLAVARVASPIGPIISISLYGQLRYADQSVLRAVCDLIPLMDSPDRRLVILGGDLNIHTHSNDPHERARAGPILELIEAIGLRNLVRVARDRLLLREGEQAIREPCPCDGSDCYHVRTHRHRGHRPGEMANNDYLYASRALEERLVSLTVMNGDDDPTWALSDHCPLVASFRVS